MSVYGATHQTLAPESGKNRKIENINKSEIDRFDSLYCYDVRLNESKQGMYGNFTVKSRIQN